MLLEEIIFGILGKKQMVWLRKLLKCMTVKLILVIRLIHYTFQSQNMTVLNIICLSTISLDIILRGRIMERNHRRFSFLDRIQLLETIFFLILLVFVTLFFQLEKLVVEDWLYDGEVHGTVGGAIHRIHLVSLLVKETKRDSLLTTGFIIISFMDMLLGKSWFQVTI